MYYSYDYNAPKGKSRKPLDEKSNGVASPNSNDGLEIDIGDSPAPIEALREIPEDAYSQRVTTVDDERILLVDFDVFCEEAERIIGQYRLAVMTSPFAEDSLNSVFEDICDEKFGEYNWDYYHHYGECEGCNKWVCTEDLYEQDWWVSPEGGFYCGDCVRRAPGRYIEWLTDSAFNVNQLLTYDELDGDGWQIVDTYDLYGSVPYPRSKSDREEILHSMQAAHPGAHFIFDESVLANYPHEYRIWAKGISEDGSEEEDDE